MDDALERRKQRYNSDPEYRAKRIAATTAWKKRKVREDKDRCAIDPGFKKAWEKKNKEKNAKRSAETRLRYASDPEFKKHVRGKTLKHRLDNRNSDAVISRRKFYTAKLNAKRRRLEFNIDVRYLRELLVAQGRKCAITGRALNYQGSYQHSDAPSIDRIDRHKGYIRENLRWVTYQVNCAIGVGSVEDFLDMCQDALRHAGRI